MVDDMKIMVNSMLGDIITTPINSNQTRMFVILNSIKYIFSDGENKVDDRAVFFTIEREKNGFGNHIEKCELLDPNKLLANANDTTVLQKVQRLTAVLKQTEVQPDEEVFLITWDHGSAFGIFRQELPNPRLTTNSVRREIEENLSQYPFIKLFWDEAKKADQGGFLKRKPKNSYTTIQAGHNLFRVKNTRDNTDRLKYYFEKESEFIYDDKAGKITFIDTVQNEIEGSGVTMNSWSELDPEAVLKDGLKRSEVVAEPKAAEILKNSELAECLRKWLGKEKKVAVLLMSNCWMMNLHTMYALKDTVKCLVAPQGSIDVPGYNLKDIFNQINKADSIRFKINDLAIVCVETFDNTYSKAKAIMLDRQEPGILEQFKIFAVDLSKTTDGESTLMMQIDVLRKLIDTLLAQLLARYAAQIEIEYFLKYVRSVCFDFSGGKVKLIDIVNWVISISSANQQFIGQNLKLTTDISSAIIDFKKAFLDNSALLKKSSGKYIYIPQNPKADFATIALPPTGNSIFFPIECCHLGLSDQDYANLKDNVSSDRLLKDLPSWRKLLKFIDPEIDAVFV